MRRNPEVERLTRENDLLRREMASMRRDPGDLPVTGCGDNSCVVAAPKGMATNGGCRCELQEVRRALQYWRRLARFREITIREMASDVARASVATSAIEALAKGAVVRVTCIVGERAVSVETPDASGSYQVIDDRGHVRRAANMDSAEAAADHFAAWLREAQKGIGR